MTQHQDRQRVIDRALETGRKYDDQQVAQYPLLRAVALDFIRSYRGTNSFVQNLAVRLVDYGTLTPPQLRGALNVMVAEARFERIERAIDSANDRGEVYIDLRRKSDREIDMAGDAIPPAEERANEVAPAIPNGTYTVILDDAGKVYRTLRVKDCPDHFTVKTGTQLIEFLNGPDNTSDFAGFALLAGRNVSIWKKYKLSTALLEAAKRLVTDPMGAAAEYVKRSNRCFVCNRPLTTPESIARGIGPICIEKISALGFEFNLMGDRDQAHEQVTLEQMIDVRIRRRQSIKERAEAELDRSLENVAVDQSDYTARGDQPQISRAQAQREIDELFPE